MKFKRSNLVSEFFRFSLMRWFVDSINDYNRLQAWIFLQTITFHRHNNYIFWQRSFDYNDFAWLLQLFKVEEDELSCECCIEKFIN